MDEQTKKALLRALLNSYKRGVMDTVQVIIDAGEIDTDSKKRRAYINMKLKEKKEIFKDQIKENAKKILE